jgi:hypothetical protein
MNECPKKFNPNIFGTDCLIEVQNPEFKTDAETYQKVIADE